MKSSHVDPSIRSSCDLRKPIACLSYHPDQRLIAAGCLSEVKVLRIDKSGAINEICGYTSTTPRAQVTDVMWSSDDRRCVAMAYSSGEIRCSALTAAGALDLQWSIKTENCINKLAWHPVDVHLLGNVDSKGFIRIHDTRQPAASASVLSCRFMNNQTKNTRDIAFTAHNPHLFGVVADNHFALRVWDRRSTRSHVMETLCKDNSHRLGITSIAWCPSQEHLLATGSVDKTVKIWDTGRCAMSPHSPSPLNPLNTLAEPVLITTLHTHAEVSRVVWAGDGQSSFVCSSSSGSASANGSGWVGMWDAKHTNLPICILKGHASNCSGLQFISCSEKAAEAELRGSAKGKARKTAGASKKAEELARFALTAGKDGMILVQDPRQGCFPYAQMSPAVTAISSAGHVAYHTAPLPQALSALFREPPTGSDKFRRFPSPAPPSAPSPTKRAPGGIILGQAKFSCLEQVLTVRTLRHNAEASVFDPALIYLLATQYSLPQYLAADASVSASAHAYAAAMTACKDNQQTAARAGLACRGAVWSALLALIPSPTAVGSVPFSEDILSLLLKDLLEIGDAQHFVIISEICRRLGLLDRLQAIVSETAVRRVYFTYIDILMKLQLACKSNEIINSIVDNLLIVSLQKDIDLHLKCTGCRKELMKRDTNSKSAPTYCTNCKAAATCSFCNLPVVGMMQWCPVCVHGGHYACMAKWFAEYNTCPTGCGHTCCHSPPAALCWESGLSACTPMVGYVLGYGDKRKQARAASKGRRAHQLAVKVYSKVRTISSR